MNKYINIGTQVRLPPENLFQESLFGLAAYFLSFFPTDNHNFQM